MKALNVVATVRCAPPPDRVPTLTEVLDPALAQSTSFAAADAGAVAEPTDLSSEIAQQISADLQAHLDRVLDARVRAALEPIFQQTVVRIIEETKRELASTLHAGMAKALAQQLSRHRNRR